MKKLISLMTCLALALGCISAVSDTLGCGETDREHLAWNSFVYVIQEDGSAEIVDCSENVEELIVPATVNGLPVTGIGGQAFSECTVLTRITLPDSIVHMDRNPFADCPALNEVIISPDQPYLAVKDGVLFSKPDRRLICYPRGLTAESYEIPEGIQEIGIYSFAYSPLREIVIPESVKKFDDGAFICCASLNQISIPTEVTSIGESAFWGCERLEEVTIPCGVSRIEDATFHSCSSLRQVNIPEGVTLINFSVFENCTALETVNIPDSVTTIGDDAFFNCSSLETIRLPEGVNHIGECAFYGCNRLVITLSRGSYATQYCKDNGIRYVYTDADDWLNDPTATPLPPDSVSGDVEEETMRQRLLLFMRYWSMNELDEMLTLCAPSWNAKQEKPKTSLFQLLLNRTPFSFDIIDIRETGQDLHRQIDMKCEIDRHNGNGAMWYQLSINMVKEADLWYVDPLSIMTCELIETPSPDITAVPARHVDDGTLLYYNPEGGSLYHVDPNCKVINSKYLPLKGHFTYGQVNDPEYAKYEPCNVCEAPLRQK